MEKNAFSALRGYQLASRTAKVLRVAHMAALGVAAASLVVGGVRVVKQFKGEE
jgi:hypothetical protein